MFIRTALPGSSNRADKLENRKYLAVAQIEKPSPKRTRQRGARMRFAGAAMCGPRIGLHHVRRGHDGLFAARLAGHPLLPGRLAVRRFFQRTARPTRGWRVNSLLRTRNRQPESPRVNDIRHD